jgi:hypothetical protein
MIDTEINYGTIVRIDERKMSGGVDKRSTSQVHVCYRRQMKMTMAYYSSCEWRVEFIDQCRFER